MYICGAISLCAFKRGVTRSKLTADFKLLPGHWWSKWCFSIAADEQGQVIKKLQLKGSEVVGYEVLGENVYDSGGELFMSAHLRDIWPCCNMVALL